MDTKLWVLQNQIKEEECTSLESLKTQYNLGDQFTTSTKALDSHL